MDIPHEIPKDAVWDDLPEQIKDELLERTMVAVKGEFHDLKRIVAGKLFVVSFMKIAFQDDELLTDARFERSWQLCQEAAAFLCEKDREAIEYVIQNF